MRVSANCATGRRMSCTRNNFDKKLNIFVRIMTSVGLPQPNSVDVVLCMKAAAY